MPSSGSLFLSEEEERTLISEGYPVPTKWPLTKQEEKILKKIQRKIKNKVGLMTSASLIVLPSDAFSVTTLENFQFLEQAFTSASVYLRISDCVSLCYSETILCMQLAHMHACIFAERYM